jgi:hypothetical protein
MKRPWHSKTFIVNFACFIALWAFRFFYPDAHKVFCDNQMDIFYGVTTTLILLNILFRRFTREPMRFKKEVLLLAALILSSCSSVQMTLEPGMFYKRDIGIEVNGQSYEGVTVIPYAKTYNITLVPKGELNLMLIRSCHREYSVEKETSGWFNFGKKPKFVYSYTPVPGIEDTRTCQLRIDAYESGKSRHSWAFLDFTSPEYKLQASLTCNGTIVNMNGVGTCQAKEQTVQRIRFNEEVRFAPPKPSNCNQPKVVDGAYEIESTVGECLYQFQNRENELGRLTIVGYQGVLVREAQ